MAHYYLFRALPNEPRVAWALNYMLALPKFLSLEEREITKWAEMYQEVRESVAISQSQSMKGRPKSAAHKENISAAWNTDRKLQQAATARRVNSRDNAALKDYTCDNCGREFQQVVKGVWGGHRKACLRSRDTEAVVNPFHTRLVKLGWRISHSEESYFRYVHYQDLRIIGVSYEPPKKLWFCGDSRGTTTKALEKFIHTDAVPKPRVLNEKEKKKYSTFQKDSQGRYSRSPRI